MPFIVATLTPKPGNMDATEAAARKAILQGQAMPGCERFSILQGDGIYVVIEQWRDSEALQTWAQSDVCKELHDNLEVLIEDARNNYVVVELLSVGDEGKSL